MTEPDLKTPTDPPKGFQSMKKAIASLSEDQRLIVQWVLANFATKSDLATKQDSTGST